MIILALIFALTNGLHDAGSVVATLIYCRAATPKQAVLLASVFGLIGAAFSGSMVADTVSKIIILPPGRSLMTILAAAISGAVLWNIVTWRAGLPSSSTHALVGGLVGAGWAALGKDHIFWGLSELLHKGSFTGLTKIIGALIISPLLGFALAFVIQKITALLLRNAKYKINEYIKRMQWFMAAALAFSHGANDSQKISGLISLTLFSAGILGNYNINTYVKPAVGLVMFIGTAFGGWKIMKTMGRGIYDIRPIHSMNSMFSSGLSIIIANFTGAPVSTTHVVVGGIAGVGAADEYKMVNWGIGKEIITAWLITIPCSALSAALLYFIINWRFL